MEVRMPDKQKEMGEGGQEGEGKGMWRVIQVEGQPVQRP